MNTKLHRLKTAAPAAAMVGLGALLFAGAGTALAAPESAGVIQYRDLNTQTPAGVQELSDRIHQAAWDYCLKVTPPSASPRSIDNLRCQEAVIDEALAKIDNPMLTRMFPGVQDEDTWRGG